MFKKFIFTTLTAGLFLAFAASASADVTCQPIYGGGESCVQVGQVSINKMVQNPQSGVFVENLTTNDPKFSPSQNITFQLNVSNNSGSDLSKVTVKDVLPQLVGFVSGPGNFDSNTNALTFTVDDLKKDQTKTFAVVGKVAESGKFPFSQGVSCAVNQSVATTSNGQSSQDNAQFCMEVKTTKGGIPVVTAPPITVTPPTGPDMLPLLALIPAGLSGLILRKRSNKNFS